MKTLFFVLLIALGFCQEVRADFDVTCESSSGQTRNCPINGSYNRVYLKTQLSRASCYEGSSWGTNDSSIWVSNGCRATFRVAQGSTNYNSHGNRYNSRDSSDNGKSAAVAAAVIIGAAAIAANNKNNNRGQYSNNSNYDRYGNGRDDYGYDNGRNSYGNDYGNRSITCESRDNQRSRCVMFVGRRNVQISRKLSNSACRYGQDWDFDNNSVYVWNGCRAVFTVD